MGKEAKEGKIGKGGRKTKKKVQNERPTTTIKRKKNRIHKYGSRKWEERERNEGRKRKHGTRGSKW
jgi:hypothetical protein